MTPMNLLCLAKARSLDDDVLANLAIAVISFYNQQMHMILKTAIGHQHIGVNVT